MTATVRKLVIALTVSVALNLFGAGFAASRVLKHRQAVLGMRANAGERFGMQRMLPGAGLLDRKAKALFEGHREQMRSHWQAISKAQQAVRSALSGEPFDRAALEQALGALRTRQTAAVEASHVALVEMAAKLDAPSRRALAERGEGLRGWWGRRLRGQ